MVYGYVIIKHKVETYGLSIYHSEGWTEYNVVTKVRIFPSEAERDRAMDIEHEQHGEWDNTEILPFEEDNLKMFPSKEDDL